MKLVDSRTLKNADVSFDIKSINTDDWSDWSNWSGLIFNFHNNIAIKTFNFRNCKIYELIENIECSVSCGKGRQLRFRKCANNNCKANYELNENLAYEQHVNKIN